MQFMKNLFKLQHATITDIPRKHLRRNDKVNMSNTKRKNLTNEGEFLSDSSTFPTLVPEAGLLLILSFLFGNLRREVLIEAPSREKRKPLVKIVGNLIFMLAEHLTTVEDVIFF